MELLFTLIDEYESINIEICMLKGVCSKLKKDVRKLEHANVKNFKWMKRPFVCMRTLISLMKP